MDDPFRAPLTDLDQGFLTLRDYHAAVASGAMVRKPGMCDDQAFQMAHPDTPLASDNRFPRIRAADAIRDLAQEAGVLTDEVLAAIHVHLFDCCATVRLSLARALFSAGDAHSAPHLQQLLEQEADAALRPDTSKAVMQAARIARDRCLARAGHIPEGQRRILVLSANYALVDALYEAADEHGAVVMQSVAGSDLLAFASAVQVVDRRLIAPNEWASYRECLRQTLGTEDQDSTPLIITDISPHDPKSSMEKGLAKPPHTVWYTPDFLPDTVAEQIARILPSTNTAV